MGMDGVEIVMDVEEQFDISIDNAEAKNSDARPTH